MSKGKKASTFSHPCGSPLLANLAPGAKEMD